MNEAFLHFVWMHHLFGDKFGTTPTGEMVEVVFVGNHNTNGGPDFTDARVKIGDTLWVGNVEVHLRSSDWFRHGHHTDRAYDNVILHVVLEDDRKVYTTEGRLIPALLLDFDRTLLNRYVAMMHHRKWIPCEDFIQEVDKLVVDVWLHKLLIERLEYRGEDIKTSLQQQNNDWDEVFYQKLARAFGYHINADPFEMLAKSLPAKRMAKHRDHLMQIEAMMFGQAGLLSGIPVDEYQAQLASEYSFLQKKYSMKPMAGYLWKHLRLRPVNFPAIRMAQLAALLQRVDNLFESLLHLSSIEEVHQLLEVPPSSYWEHHYDFGKPSRTRIHGLGEEMRRTVIINVFVPFLYYYGTLKNRKELVEIALTWLEKLAPENNQITRQWERLGVHNENAFISQALIQLKKEYCHYRRCLSCQVGKSIIAP
jgi:hypothetical protein